MPFHGQSLIAGQRMAGNGPLSGVRSPLDGAVLPGTFTTATEAEVDAAMRAAAAAFVEFSSSTGETRARFLETIAQELENLGTTLIERANLETGLTPQRLESERHRTVSQLRMFATIAREHSWLDVRIERAQPERKPAPKPDIRRMLQPIGPIVVFGASNFPLAYSVAGGDTASALATGNPVVVKAHEAHPGTSELVGEIIVKAAAQVGLPAGVFSMIQGNGRTVGPWLVRHPATKAVAFTGSLAGGRALFDIAAKRPDPIPVFAEMGSLNPVILLPGAIRHRGAEIGRQLAASATDGAGQFCTKPGIFIACESVGLDSFRQALAQAVSEVPATTMLHSGIADAFFHSTEGLREHPGLKVLAHGIAPYDETGCQSCAWVMETKADSFLASPELAHEVFGPFALLVVASSLEEVVKVVDSLGGQLTASIFADEKEIEEVAALAPRLSEIAGRLIFNGVPTGLEVNTATQHGGPWPASTDSRFTSMGSAALQRFVRPVAYQNYPPTLLPDALRDENPLRIVRSIDGKPHSEQAS
jgi:alpha-ketoglutaric semialdehyde dehydrogenase